VPPESAPVTGPYAPTSPLAAAAPKATTDIFSSEGFLKLLATQISSQNPLDPMKDTEFVAQMASFSQLEQTTNMAANIKALTMSSQLSQGAALIGRSVTYQPANGTDPVTGVVQSLTVGSGGRSLNLVVGGVSVDMSQVSGITA
jgi:flagellar basal-body rod modification protein FlgD